MAFAVSLSTISIVRWLLWTEHSLVLVQVLSKAATGLLDVFRLGLLGVVALPLGEARRPVALRSRPGLHSVVTAKPVFRIGGCGSCLQSHCCSCGGNILRSVRL